MILSLSLGLRVDINLEGTKRALHKHLFWMHHHSGTADIRRLPFASTSGIDVAAMSRNVGQIIWHKIVSLGDSQFYVLIINRPNY